MISARVSDLGIWLLRMLIAASAGIIIGSAIAGAIIALQIGIATLSHGAMS